MKTNNPHRYDGVSTKMLKLSSNYITSNITHICNKIIPSGTFPDRLKFSIIKPVYKKRCKIYYTNSRPISLLTSFSKVFEEAIYTRLTEYLINDKLLLENQYGFSERVPTDNTIFKLINETLNSRNNKIKVGSFFCDLQTACDTLNHELLLDKLQNY